MFDNIGGKIKKLASFIAWLGIIISIIIGIAFMATDEELFLVGLIIAIIGGVSSWVGSFLLYGFGELVENSSIIAQKRNENFHESKVSNTTKYEEVVKPTTPDQTEIRHKWSGNCQMCGRDNVMITSAMIVDDLGTRYRNVCDNCFEKYNCKSEK